MNKPSELAVMVGIFSLVIITSGFFIASGAQYGGENATLVNDYVINVYSGMNGTNGIVSTGDQLEQGILTTNVSASGEADTVGGVLVQGWNSLKKLGYSFDIVSEAMSDTSGLFGIDPIYWLVLSSMILITFAVVMWTWFIGGGQQ